MRRSAPIVLLVAALTALLALVAPSTASAHTDFDTSVPADGDAVDSPVEAVTIAFTGEPTALDDGFTALTPQGALQSPSTVDVVQPGSFALGFDPPLAGGDVGIRWRVQSADGHVIEGAFAFTVTAPLPTTTPPTTIPATTTAPTAPPTTTPDPAGEVTPPPAEAAATTTTAVVVAAEDTGVASSDPTSTGDAAAVPTLEEFLDTDGPAPGERLAAAGRLVTFPALAVGLGALAFAATTMRGRRREVSGLLRSVQVLGTVVAVGAVIEYAGVARLGDESLGSAWSTQPGLAAGLRAAGGVLLAFGVAATLQKRARPLSAATVEAAPSAPPDEATYRWQPDRRSAVAGIGAVLLVVSFWFDGHTVTRGPRLVHAVVDSVHVVAASVWVGGVVVLAVVAGLRRRSGRPTGVAELAVRFSPWATIALVAVAAAGVVMAIFVLDGFGDLTGTDWGRLLLVKTGAVVVAASAGAYNHVVLVPRLDADVPDPSAAGRIRLVLTVEAVVLVTVVVLTALLVGAAV